MRLIKKMLLENFAKNAAEENGTTAILELDKFIELAKGTGEMMDVEIMEEIKSELEPANDNDTD